MKFLPKIIIAACLISGGTVVGQATAPFTACPEVTAIARPGTNTYTGEPVSIYNYNFTTGVATVIPGGPIKNPALPGVNMDVNAVGLNSADGFLYAMQPAVTTTPNFYRIGSNYSIVQLGVIATPTPTGLANVGVVNSAAGEVDASDNYYFTAETGTLSFFPPTFTPRHFFLGRIPNVSLLPAGTGTITPQYLTFTSANAACSNFYQTLIAPVTAASFSSATNTGIRDIVYNPRDNSIYTYVTFEDPIGSGNFQGELIRASIATGAVHCYPASALAFVTPAVEVAGTAMTPTGEIDVLFTDGSVYKTDMAGPNTFTGTISFLNNSGLPNPERSDFAACVAANGVVPVNFTDVTATAADCSVTTKWSVAQEQNVKEYDVQVADRSGSFSTAAVVAARNSSTTAVYAANFPVISGSMNVRVKEVDYDGMSTYSKIVSVQSACDRPKSLIVLNSASVSNTLQYRLDNISSEDRFTVSLYNDYGALLMKQVVTGANLSNLYSMDVSKLAAGNYLIMAQSDNGTRLSARFIRQ